MGKKKRPIIEKQPSMFDEENPLTCVMIAEILALFLKCNPAVSFVKLPDFRLKQLLECAVCLTGRRKRVQEENMFEAIGSFYCLCLYYGGTIEFDDFSVALDAVSFIQSVLSECLISFDWIGDVTLAFTDDRIDNMEFIFQDMKHQQLEVFIGANDLLKDIIRDLIKQVRSCRDSKQEMEEAKEREAKKGIAYTHPPVDCLLAHSLYLVATYALGHMAGIVYTEKAVVKNIVPGLYEAMLCVFHLDCEREGKRLRRFEKLKRNKIIEDEDRFLKCLQMAKCLSFVAIKNCNVNFVQQIRIVRGRLSRGKPTSEVDFAKLKASSVESSLFRQEKDSSFTLTDEEREARKLPIRTHVNLVEEPIKYPLPHRTVEATMYITIGREVPEILVISLEDNKKEQSSHSLALTETTGPIAEGDGGDDDDAADVLSGDYRDLDEMCGLKVFLRPYYLMTRAIREYHKGGPHYFNLTDQNNRQFGSPAKKKIQKSTPNETKFETSDMIINNLEQAYYESAQRPFPRFLDQREGLYWVCDVIVERLFHEVKAGRTFINVNEPYIGALQAKMKREVAAIRKSRVTGKQEIELCMSSARLAQTARSSKDLLGGGGSATTAIDTAIDTAQLSGDVVGEPIVKKDPTMKSGAVKFKKSLELSIPTTPIKSRENKGKATPNPQSSMTQTISIKESTMKSKTTPVKIEKDIMSMESPTVQALKFSGHTSVIKKKKVKSLDLMERLNLARKEAVLERKLEIMSEDGEIQRSVVQRQRLQALEKKFKPLGLGDENSENSEPSVMNLTTRLAIIRQESYNEMGALQKKGQKSCVWVPPPEPEDEMERRKKVQQLAAERALQEETARSFSIPEGLAAKGKEYIAKIKKEKEEAKKKAREEFQERGDMHDMEVAFVKKLKQQKMAEARALIRNDVNESLNIKKRAESQKKEMNKKLKNARKAEAKLRKEQNEAEVERFEEHKRWKLAAQKREEEGREERRQMEAIRLKNMSDHKEYDEILRRIREEERMRYLEGIQRKKEEKRFEVERKRAMELLEKQEKVRIEKQKILNDIRKSNFLYHNGKLGYYRDIRDEPLPFIQYEDDWGNPYYLDPLKNETVYELPPDATVKHHTEKEAEDYDLLYGEGAYAEVLADRAFKMQCNADRGYVGEDGEWVNLGGYYDENFEFVITF